MANLLAFDTSSERLHAGLAIGNATWAVERDGGARTSRSLVSTLQALLHDAGINWDDLDAIAFGRGPGAFTGLRAACAVAQGLALGSGKPVLALDTLLAVAESAHMLGGASDLWVAMDARMGEIYAARYQQGDEAWQTVEKPALYPVDDLNARWRASPPAWVAGSALAAFGQRLDTGAARRIEDAAPTGIALLNCAAEAWAGGSGSDPALALPTYLRDRVALTMAERESAQVGRDLR